VKGHQFQDIQPGDIGFDGGIGLSGFLIRIGTGSAYGHCFVYHRDLGNGVWETMEAGPSGLKLRKRTRQPNKVVRVWRDEAERHQLLRVSSLLRGCKYGWGEIARIVANFVGVKFDGKDNPRRAICSNHVAQAAIAARPELVFYMDYQTYEVWPGELAVTLDEFLWDTDHK
jgi:hypothetical protein